MSIRRRICYELAALHRYSLCLHDRGTYVLHRVRRCRRCDLRISLDKLARIEAIRRARF